MYKEFIAYGTPERTTTAAGQNYDCANERKSDLGRLFSFLWNRVFLLKCEFLFSLGVRVLCFYMSTVYLSFPLCPTWLEFLSIYEEHVIMSEISVSIVITVRRCIEYIMHISMNILVLYCYICS